MRADLTLVKPYFIICYPQLFNFRREERRNMFYLWLYGVRHMLKNHSDREREETRCRHIG